MNILTPSFRLHSARMLAALLLLLAANVPLRAQATPQITEMLKKHHAANAAKQAFTSPPQALTFIENKGQWQGNGALGTPRFLARTRGANVWVMDDGFVYDFTKRIDSAHHEGHVVKMRFADIGAESRRAASSPSGGSAQDASHAHGIQQLPGYHNYFLGSDSTKWATNVPLYAEVRMNAIADGISARTYFDEGSVRYDLIVAPGADPNRIALQFDGIDAEKVRIGKNGDLVLQTSIGEVMQGKLFAYQVVNGKKHQIPCAFAITTQKSELNTQHFSFALGSYDPTLPLVIDPLLWSTFLGGTSTTEGINKIAIDASGNSYVVGKTNSTNFPMVGGSYQTTYQGGTADGYVTKLNAAGTALVYSTFLGGSLNDELHSIKVDASGNAYVCGESYSTNYPITLGSGGGEPNCIVTKLNATGTALLYSRYFGGSATELALDIAIDASGNAYVAGHTYSNDFSVSGGAYQTSRAGASDGVVFKLDNGGNMVFSTYIGGTDDDFTIYCTTDAANNVYLVGYARAGYPTTGGAYQTTYGGGAVDVIVTKMNSTGTALLYSTYIGGAGDDFSRSVAIDASNNIYVAGYSTGGFPTTLGPAYSGGTSDGTIFKLNAAGSALTFSRYLGGSTQDQLLSLALDGGTGDIYTTGFTDSPNFPTSLSAYQTAIGGGYDVVVSKLNNAGSTILYSSYFGGINDDQGLGIAFSAANTVFLAGGACPTTPTTVGAFQTTYGGGTTDGFVTKFLTVPEAPTVTSFTATTGYPGLGIVITGTNFIGVSAVQFGGINSPSFTVISPTQLVAAVPAGGVSGSVSVTNSGGTGTSVGSFTFSGTVPQVSTVAGNAAGAGFADGQNGAARLTQPWGGIKIGGDIYFTEFNGHRVRKYNIATGNVTTLAGSGVAGYLDATGTAAQFNNPQGLTYAAGDLYVADGNNHCIRKITVGTGVVTTFAGSGAPGFNDAIGTAAQFNNPAGLEWDGTYIYVCDVNNNRIRRIQVATAAVTTLAGNATAGNADGIGAAAQFNRPIAITLGTGAYSSYLYVAGYYGNNIRQVSITGNVVTIAGSVAGMAGFADGVGGAALFDYPGGIITDGSNLFISDGNNHAIRTLQLSTNTVNTYSATNTPAFIDGTLLAARYNNPTGLVYDAAGVFYVMDQLNNSIRRVSPAPPTVTSFTPSAYPMQVVTITGTNLTGASQVQFGAINAAWFTVDSPTQIRAVVPFLAVNSAVSVTTPAGTASLAGFTVAVTPEISTYLGDGTAAYLDAAGQAMQVGGPSGGVFSSTGDFYFAESNANNHIIRKITPSGVSTVLAGNPGNAGYIDAIGTAARFNQPHYLAIDGANNIYVTDYNNHRIRMITPAGVVTTFAGSGLVASGDGTGMGASFSSPIGIVYSAVGNCLYVSEDGGHNIRRVSLPGAIVTTLAGSGAPAYADGTGAGASFNKPRGMAVDAAGNIYVADFQNHRIRKVTPGGVVTTLAGSGTPGFADGIGTAAQFSQPRCLTIDAAGTLYVGHGFQRIRMITTCGAVRTIAGSGTAGATDGILSVGQLGSGIEGLTLNAAGELLVSDRSQHRIRKVLMTKYQFVSGDAGDFNNWKLLPGLLVSAPNFTTFGSQFIVPSMLTAIASTSFTLGANATIFIQNDATLAINSGQTLTNNGALSIADGAMGGRLLLTGTGAVATNSACYAGANATLESSGGAAKILSTLELPAPMPGKVVITNTVGTSVPATTTIGATGTISINAGGHLRIPIAASVLNNNAVATSFTVQSGGVLEFQGTGEVAAASASVVNYVAGSTLEFSGVGPKIVQAPEFPATMNGNVLITSTGFVTLNAAKTLSPTSTLTLTAGKIITSAANMLLVNNTAAGAIVTGTGYIDGPLQRRLPASLAAPAVTYSFPVGVGGTAYPFAVIEPTTGGTGPVLQVDAYAGAAVGATAGTNISSLSGGEHWRLQQIGGTIGDYASGRIFLQCAGLDATKAIGGNGNAASTAGAYNGNVSTHGTGLTTNLAVAGVGHFLYGTGPLTYDWNGATSNWQLSTNWTPTRSPAPTDILRFNVATTSPDNIPTETIQQLIINVPTTFNAAVGIPKVLSIGTGGVQINAGGILGIGSVTPLSLNLLTGCAMTVANNGILNVGDNVITGAGTFTLNGGATLYTFNNDGVNGTSAGTGTIQVPGANITYSPTASYTFTATNVSNRFLGFASFAGKPPITQCADLTIGSGGLARTMDNNFTASGAITVNGRLQTAAQTLTMTGVGAMTIANSAQTIINAGGLIANNGAGMTVQNGGMLQLVNTGQIDPASSAAINYVPGSVLQYAGTLAKTTNAKETNGVQQVQITNTAPVTLGANATVQQALAVNDGSKLILSNVGNPTLTLNGSVNLNTTGLLASVNGANAGSLTLNGTNAATLRFEPANNTLNNFMVNRSGVHTLPNDVNVLGTLTLMNGVLVPNVRVFSGDPAGTAAGIITGGSTMSYIQGSLQRRFVGGIVANGTNYAFPVGSATAYRPATLVDVKTAASPIVQVDVADAGATMADTTLTALFGARNWRVQTLSGVFNGSAIALTETGLTASNVVARSTAQSGAYTRAGGNNVTTSVTSDANAVPSAANHYFAIGSVQPVVTSLSPTTVSPGDTLTITGVSLGGVLSVGIGGIVAAGFQVISPTQLRVIVGQGASGKIVLITSTGVAESSQSVVFLNAPVITSFSPSYGTTGSTVRVSGARLTSVSNLSFGGTNALNLTSVDANTLDAVVGNGSSGILSVQTPAGIGTSSAQFDFILKPSIVNFFPKWAKIGDTVKIYGGNFPRVSGVKLGGSAFQQVFTLVTSGQINILVPPDASTGMIRTTNPVGTDSSWIDFTFTGQPTLTSISPNRTIFGMGQEITVSGTEFHPVPTVMIGSVTAASVKWTDLKQIKATFTQVTTGVLAVIASGGTVSYAQPIQIVPPPVISSFAPTAPSPGDFVTVTGANFFPGNVNISIGGVPVSSLTVNSSTQLTFVVPPALGGPLVISSIGGSVQTTGANLNIVPAPTITGASGVTTATIGQTLFLQGTGLTNINAMAVSTVQVTTFATIGSTGTLMNLTVPPLPGLDPNSPDIITTEASISLLTRSGFATYTMLFRNRAPLLGSTSGTSTNATSTNSTMQGQNGMRITSVSPVVLPEGSDITLQGVNIATNASVWAGSLRLAASQQSTTAIVVRIPEGFVPQLLLSTTAILTVSSPTVQVTVPFAVQVNALAVPNLFTFFPLMGTTRAIVSIIGQNFALPNFGMPNAQERGSVRSVSIGGVPVQAFRVVSPSLIQVTVGSVQTGLVRVQTASGLLLSQQEFTLDTSQAAVVVAPPEPVVSKDSIALNRIFAATQGMSWTTNSNWTNLAPVALRYGIKVRNNRVVEIRLPNSSLRGALPPEALQDLDALEVLDVAGNALTGAIPPELTKATKLEVLRLAGNHFTGSLPQGLCALGKLREVDLSGNSIEDSLSSLCCLSQVAILNLRGNKFMGTMPACVQNLAAMNILDIAQNRLSGVLPDAIGRLAQLQTLRLRGNRFTGSFPAALGRSGVVAFSKQTAQTSEALGLETLDIGENNFTGEIPAELGNFPNVRTILLDRNQFTGAIPQSILSLTRLRRLDVAWNQLSDAPDLGAIPRLDTLIVNNNRFPIEVLERFAGRRVLTYLPQTFAEPRIVANGVDTSRTITMLVNEPFRLAVAKPGFYARTTWKRDGQVVRTVGDTSRYADFRVNAFALSDTGVYECVITDELLPELIITTAQVRILGRLPAIAPSAVRLLTPLLGEEDLGRTPSFSWTSSINASAYRIECASDSSFANILATASVPQSADILSRESFVANPQTLPSLYASGFPLNADRRYFWRVQAENAVGASAWVLGSFTTAPPDALVAVGTLDLGKIARYDTARGIITVRNLGEGALTLESVRADNADFTLETVQAGTVLAAGGELRLRVNNLAQRVGSSLSPVTVRFRSGMSSTVQTRTLANRITLRVSGLKLVPPALDTVIVNKRQLNTAQVVNLSDEEITLRSASLLDSAGVYSLRAVEKDLTIAAGETITLLVETTARRVGLLAPDRIQCVAVQGDLTTASRAQMDTAQVSIRAIAREPRREDVFVKVGVKAVQDSIAPGGAVTLEVYVVPVSDGAGSTGSFQQIVRAAQPSFSGTVRWNPNVLVLAPNERGARQVRVESSTDATLKSFAIPTSFWSGRTSTMLTLQALSVAGNTDVTPLEIETLQWGAGTVFVEAFETSTFTAKACEAGGKRLVTSAKTTQLAVIAPNPAKDEVSIAYTLREDGVVEIALVDAHGKTAQMLIAEEQMAGEYSITKALKNVPSGSYTVRLQTRSGVVTKRVNVVR